MAEFLPTPLGTGIVFGLLLAVLLGVVIFWLNIWLKSITALFKPQYIVLTTKKSPFDVFVDAVKFTLLTIGIVVVILRGIYLYYF